MGAARAVYSTLRGHLWTVAPLASWLLKPEPLTPFEPWSTELSDPDVGRVVLSGALHRRRSAATPRDRLLVAVHGLAGDIDSHYIHRAALAADHAGMDCLRLNLRGADMSGCDYYHAGLTDDLTAALASPSLADYRHVVVLGYSLGGHIALAYAAGDHADPRLIAVAAVCPPLDLVRAVRDIDARHRWPYRQYLLSSLKQMLEPMARRGRLPLPLERARAIRSLRSWDQELVVPRFGFGSVEDYYRQATVVPRLDALSVPALVVATRHDPMVLAGGLEAALAEPRAKLLAIRWLERAGHVGFPSDVSLGVEGPLGLEPQALAWLTTRCEAAV
jgi:hypothetical protein